MPIQAWRALNPIAKVGFSLLIAVALAVGGVTATLLFLRIEMSQLERGQMLLLVTTVGGFIVGYLREVRNRAWAIEDRKRDLETQTAEIISKAQAEATALLISTEAKAQAIHLEVQTAAEKIRLDTLRAAALLREEQRIDSERLALQIADVHTEAKRAYTEANHVNEKIENLNRRLLTEEEHGNAGAASKATTKKLDAIQATADEIDSKVDVLAEAQTRKPVR